MQDERKPFEPIKLTVQLKEVKTTSDGGGKITFEFGADSLSGIQQIISLNASGETSMALALVPYFGL